MIKPYRFPYDLWGDNTLDLLRRGLKYWGSWMSTLGSFLPLRSLHMVMSWSGRGAVSLQLLFLFLNAVHVGLWVGGRILQLHQCFRILTVMSCPWILLVFVRRTEVGNDLYYHLSDVTPLYSFNFNMSHWKVSCSFWTINFPESRCHIIIKFRCLWYFEIKVTFLKKLKITVKNKYVY